MISLGVIILFSVYCGAACNDHPGRAPLNPTIKPYAKNVKAVKKLHEEHKNSLVYMGPQSTYCRCTNFRKIIWVHTSINY